MVVTVSSEHQHRGRTRLLLLGGENDGARSLIERLAEPSMLETEQNYTFETSSRAFVTRECSLNSDLVVILVDVRDEDLTRLRQNVFIAHLLGFQALVIATTDLDTVRYNQADFVDIETRCKSTVFDIGIAHASVIPISLEHDENITKRSEQMSWYGGETLAQHLDAAPLIQSNSAQGFRFPVDDVSKAGSVSASFTGLIAGADVENSSPVIVMPSGARSTVQSVRTNGDETDRADVGSVASISLEDDVDISKGDIICHRDHEMIVTDQIQAHIIWKSDESMIPGRQYSIKFGHQSATAWISELKHVINVSTMEHVAAKTLEQRDIGVCNLSLDRRIACDAYADCRETGVFQLVDRFSKDIVGNGIVDFSLRRARNLTLQSLTMNKQVRAEAMGQEPLVIWFTGLSGAGKSTIANAVEGRLFSKGYRTYLLDGDNVRHGLNRDLGFTEVDRVENIRRFGEVAKLFADAGLIALVSAISPFQGERDMVRDLLDDVEFIEVFVDASLETCEKRDPKGLYARARKGEIQNFTGIDSPYEPPLDPELVLDTDALSPDEAADQVIELIESKYQNK